MWARNEVIAARGDDEHEEEGRGGPRQAGSHQSAAEPCKQRGEQRGSREDEAVQPGESVHQRHAALSKPLLCDPGLIFAGEAERVGSNHRRGPEDFLADDGVPERAGVSEHLRRAECQQPKKEDEEDAGIGAPCFAIEIVHQ